MRSSLLLLLLLLLLLPHLVCLLGYVVVPSSCCCPLILFYPLRFSLVFRTLLFNIFVPLVLNFSRFCASFLCYHCCSSCSCSPCLCCWSCWCCWCCCCYYVRAKLLVKYLSGAESLTQFFSCPLHLYDSEHSQADSIAERGVKRDPATETETLTKTETEAQTEDIG